MSIPKEYNVDTDPTIQKELGELEGYVKGFAKKVDNCDISEPFIDIVGIVGGLYRKYTKFTYLPKTSMSGIRLDSAVREFKTAQLKFVRNCNCKKK